MKGFYYEIIAVVSGIDIWKWIDETPQLMDKNIRLKRQRTKMRMIKMLIVSRCVLIGRI